MVADPGSSYALFALAWALMCVVAAALVTTAAFDGGVDEPGSDAGHPTR